MSLKNRLQEYFQKQGKPLPQYETVRVDGTDHRPVWQSCVHLYDGKKYIGDPDISKTKAEISAAENALMEIESSKTSILRGITERTVLLVDVENMPNFIDEVVKEITGLRIYAFIGEHHCLANKIYPAGVIKVLSPSTRSDGTDTCMQVYTGFLLGSQDYYNRYLIATRDHYGSALIDMITSNIGFWIPKEARLVTQVSHIY